MTRARDLADLGGSADAGTVTGESLIINGDMAVAQRATSSTTMSGGYHTVDRFYSSADNIDQLAGSVSQSTEAPSGFSYSFRVQVTTAETALAADELFYFLHHMEAQNLQHLNYGTSDAKTITLSFWVRSSLTGTYSVLFYGNDNARSATKTYTINTADTWEYKTITVDGDTTDGINNDNGIGLSLYFTLAAGSTYKGSGTSDYSDYVAAKFADGNQVDFSAQTGNYYITGLKLEVGSTATPFKHESYDKNLRKCQRYYQSMDYYYDFGSSGTGAFYYTPFMFPVTMRANPTMTASAWGSNTGDADTRHGTTSVNGWIMQSVVPTGCLMRGNHANIYNRMRGRGKFDAELL